MESRYPLRIICFLTLLLLSRTVMADQSTDKPIVLASASIFADMATALAGSFCDVQTIVPIGGDPHIYEATPGDAIRASKAALILRNGLTFEGWLNELIENSGTHAEVVLITEGITPITSKAYKNAPDPHAWMDAENGIIYVQNIASALIRLMPEYEKEIQFNLGVYIDQIRETHAYIIQRIKEIPENKRVLITSHDAFQYYGRKYGLRLESVLGTSTDAQVQTSDIIRLNKVISETQVPSVFIETTVNPKLLKQIASDNNVTIGGKLFSDSIGDENSPAPTYIEMLRYNTEVIVSALTRKKGEERSDNNDSNQELSPLYYIIPAILLFGIITILVLRKRS